MAVGILTITTKSGDTKKFGVTDDRLPVVFTCINEDWDQITEVHFKKCTKDVYFDSVPFTFNVFNDWIRLSIAH